MILVSIVGLVAASCTTAPKQSPQTIPFEDVSMPDLMRRYHDKTYRWIRDYYVEIPSHRRSLSDEKKGELKREGEALIQALDSFRAAWVAQDYEVLHSLKSPKLQRFVPKSVYLATKKRMPAPQVKHVFIVAWVPKPGGQHTIIFWSQHPHVPEYEPGSFRTCHWSYVDGKWCCDDMWHEEASSLPVGWKPGPANK